MSPPLPGEGGAAERLREELASLERGIRSQALLVLAAWERLDIPNATLFPCIAALQRPSFGSWNGLLAALRRARIHAQREGDTTTRERIEGATELTSLLAPLETRPDAATRERWTGLAALTGISLPSNPRLRDLIVLPVALRNRLIHDAITDATTLEAALDALEPLTLFLDQAGVLGERSGGPAPWFLEEGGETAAFNGLTREDHPLYVFPGGRSKVVAGRASEVLQAFQRLLGKTRIQESDFKRLLSRLAPEEIRGVLLGDFLVGRPVGSGGFATVHTARQLSTGRKVALKILRDGMAPEDVQRFRNEAAFLSRFDHPHVVSVIASGEETWRAPRNVRLDDEAWFQELSRSAPVKTFIALEWIEGKTLEEIFRDTASIPEVGTLTSWFRDAASALAAVHGAGLLHRDLKPGNLMVTTEGRLVLMDFGIARVRDESRTLVTTTGKVLGTPAYMSPEQIRAGEAEAEVGPRSDVYSLCATFYELYTRSRLYDHDRESAETVRTAKLAGKRPARPRLHTHRLSWEIETILLGGLETEPADRYASAADVERDLRRLLADEPIEFRKPSLRRRLRLGYRRNRVLTHVVAAFLVLAIAGVAFYVQRIETERAETARRERETRAALERAYVDRGLALVEKGDLLVALPWLVEAMRLFPDDEERQRVHRLRLASVLRACPEPVRMFFPAGGREARDFDPDGERLLLVLNRVDQVEREPGSGRLWPEPKGEFSLIDIASGEELAASEPIDDIYDELTFSEDGRRILARRDPLTHLFDAETLRPVSAPVKKEYYLSVARPSPDGSSFLLVSVQWDEDRKSPDDTGWIRTMTLVKKGEGEPAIARYAPPLHEGERKDWQGLRLKIGVKLLASALSRNLDRVALASRVSSFTTVYPPTSDDNDEVLVLDPSTGLPLAPPFPIDSDIRTLLFRRDGNALAVGCGDGSVLLLDPATGDPRGPTMWSDEPVTVIAFDVAGDLLAAGTAPYGGGGSVRVFDPGTGQPLTPPLRFEDPVTCLAFSPSGELLVVGTSREESSSGAFRVFASRSGDPRTPTVRLDGPTARVSFSRDETHVLGISRGGVARVLRLPPPLPFEEARGETNPMHTEWVDPTGTLVLSNAPGPREIETKGLFAWNPFTLERRRTPEIDAQLLAMRFEASDSLLLTTWSDEKLRLFSLPDLEPVGVPIPSEGKVVKMSLSPKGDLLLFTREGEIQSVDVARGERVSRLEIEGELGATLFAGTGEAVLIAQEAGSFSVGKSLLRWNPRTGVVEARFDAEEEMDRFFLSEDERTVLVVRDDAAFRALEAATLAPRGDWMDVPGYATIQAVSPDGERLLATDGPFVHQLLLSTGLPATPALEHAAEVRLVRYTDEGRRILTASADRSARLYSSATGLPTSPPFRLEAPVDHAALSPDRLLLVVSGGSSSTIFDARTAQRVTLSGQVPSGRNTRFSPDGSRLISHSGFDEFGSFWVCVLPDEKRPTLRLASLAALLSSRRFDVSSDLSLMTVKELEVAWQEAAISPPYGLGPRAEPKPRELTPDELDFLRSLPDRPSRVEDGR